MKQFLVFAGHDHYPRGGFKDFQGDVDTLDEARQIADKFTDRDWVHIVDTGAGKEMTYDQHDRIDFVDNAIMELVEKLAEGLMPLHVILDHDVELIGEVRDAIQTQLVDRLELMSEMEFYPYIKVDGEDYIVATKALDTDDENRQIHW